MFRTLRWRLILSHLLPFLVVLPLTGIALIYSLENWVLLPALSKGLRAQADLVAYLAAGQPGVWQRGPNAERFAETMAETVAAQVMIIDSNERVIASSAVGVVGSDEPLLVPGLRAALSGDPSVRTSPGRDLSDEVIDVLVPVRSLSEGRVVGAVRLTQHQASVYELFLQLRYLIVVLFAAALALASGLGWTLALTLARPLRRVTAAVSGLADGKSVGLVPEGGPEEIAHLARSFNALVERLQALEQSRRTLLANLVHELARPLGAMRSAIQALRQGAQDDAALRDDLLSGTDEELQRLGRLVDDLAQLHDRAVGPLELARRPLSLSTWLQGAIAPWREAARAKGLRWESQVPDDLPVIDLDTDRLGQALGNLIANAIKFTPEAGTVSISAGYGPDSAWIKVSDTGPGVAAADRHRIFSAFYRGNQGRRFPQGVGLGLTIAQEVVLAHGGQLRLDSPERGGATFTITLPRFT